MRFKVLLTFALLLFSMLGFAQQTMSPDAIEEDLVDEIISESDEEYDYSEISSRLQYFLKRPIDLNRADERQLSELFFLSPLQVNAILEHRSATGALVSLYELQAISGFDENTIRRLLPFVTLDSTRSVLPGFREGRHDLMLRYGRVL